MNPPLVEDQGELENISGIESSHAQNHTKPRKDQRSKSKYQAIIIIITTRAPMLRIIPSQKNIKDQNQVSNIIIIIIRPPML